MSTTTTIAPTEALEDARREIRYWIGPIVAIIKSLPDHVKPKRDGELYDAIVRFSEAAHDKLTEALARAIDDAIDDAIDETGESSGVREAEDELNDALYLLAAIVVAATGARDHRLGDDPDPSMYRGALVGVSRAIQRRWLSDE